VIRVLLIRHGIAEDALPGQADGDRPLSGEGWTRTRAAMAGLLRRGMVPTRGFSSGLRRADETLTCLLEAAKGKFPTATWEGLAPEGSPAAAETWLRALLAEAQAGEILAVVGHMPLTATLIARLTGRHTEVKKASCTVLGWDGRHFSFLRHLTPAELRS
jgi:phosphohistidine phosphatase SixA